MANSFISVRGKKIGNGELAYIVAEMAWSHDGSFENAITIIKAAAKAKADAICIHLTSMPDYMVNDYKVLKSGSSKGADQKSLYDFLVGKNLSENDWSKIIELAHNLNLAVCAMCNDVPSIKFAVEKDVDVFVVPPAAMVEQLYLERLSKINKPIFIRVGGATLEEVENTVQKLEKEGKKEICLIHGFQKFPTAIEDMDLNLIETYKTRFSVPVGFADHIDGGAELACILPLVAIAKGANIIEKHITYDRELKGIDYESALDPLDFINMVKHIREIEASFGKKEFGPLSENEFNYRLVARKRCVASRTISEGESLSYENVTFKRANDGIYPEELEAMLGKKTIKSLPKNYPITKDIIL